MMLQCIKRHKQFTYLHEYKNIEIQEFMDGSYHLNAQYLLEIDV